MLALLALVPKRDWLYGGAVVGLLVGFWIYSAHEREVGAAHERAAVAAATAKAVAANSKVVSDANTQIAKAAATAARAAPPTDSPHVFVRQCAPAAHPVQADRGAEPDLHDPAESSVEHSTDIGPGLDTIGWGADIEITYLQSYVRACQAAGYCKK